MDKNQGTAAADNAAKQDQAPDDSLGLNGAVAAMLQRNGITPSGNSDASAADAEEGADAHSQQQSQDTDADESDESDETETGEGGEDGESAGEGDEDESDESDAPKWYQKRIGKLTARTKAAEEQVEQLKAKIQAIESSSAKPKASATFDDDPDLAPLMDQVKQYRQEVATATNLRAQLAKDPESVAAVIKKVRPDLPNYEPETLRDFLTDYIGEAKASLGSVEGQITERRKATEAKRDARRGQVFELTKTEFPWVADTSDPRAQRFNELLKDPVVSRAPDAAFFIAAGLEKLQGMEARQKAGQSKPKATDKPRVRPPASGAAAPARNNGKDPLADLRTKARAGDPEAAKALAKAAVAASLTE